MKLTFRLFDIIKISYFQMEKKLKTLNHLLPPTLFCLFLGFLVGNFFGTFLNFFRIFLPWDGFLILLLLFFIEYINFIVYRTKKLNKLQNIIWSLFNFFKIGLLLGFFIDAFKVGS